MRDSDDFPTGNRPETPYGGKDADTIGDLLRRAADHAIRFRETIAQRPHRPLCGYMQALETFREAVPETGDEARAVIDDLAARAEPGLHAMTGPRFFGWVIGGSHPAGVAADWLTGAWGQNTGNHHAAPSAAAVETVAGGWLVDLLDLPRRSSVGFVTGATMANFTGLAAARGAVLRRAGWDADAQGLFGAPPITVLIGDDAHTTVFSALQFLGLGHDRVVRIETDGNGRMIPDSFAAAAGRLSGPAIAVLQAGQINTGAFDDFQALVPHARKAGAWIHVDGAFGLWARACPQRSHLARGLDEADSWAVDGHKWLQTPYDCGYAIVRDEEAHRRAMTIAASYLPPTQEGERDPSHFVPELSRRARGFATWAMIKHLGRAGIAAMIERNCRAAHGIAERLRADNGIAILNDVVLNQVLVRFGVDGSDDEADRLTDMTIRRIQSDGVCFAGGTKWRGRQAMRLSVTSWLTDEEQGRIVADAIRGAWTAVRSGRKQSSDPGSRERRAPG